MIIIYRHILYNYKQSIENSNISRRWNLWKSIIHEETCKITRILNLNKNLLNINNIEISLSPNEYKRIVNFIINWNGLKLKGYEMPKTAKEYQQKSRGWLNGRRAIQYGKYLYPIMIQKAEMVCLSNLYMYYLPILLFVNLISMECSHVQVNINRSPCTNTMAKY